MVGRRSPPSEGLTPAPTRLTARCAGSCYPADPAEALPFFAQALRKVAPQKKIPLDPRYPIVPHIDFRVNLDLYAQTYALWRDANWFPTRIVILGVGHRCPAELASLPVGYQTLLGGVEADNDLFSSLSSTCPFLGSETRGFQGEHSIEFVVIWLQALRDLFFPGRSFTILPVLCGGLQPAVEAGAPPCETSPESVFARSLGKLSHDPDTAIVASIDGCHVGPRFQHPFAADKKIRAQVAEWEKKLWALASTETLSGFFQHLGTNRNGFYFDGVGVLHALLAGQNLRAKTYPAVQWHEPSDQSIVSFSRGHLLPHK
ncbi:AmmeMemoRadiSam system protein B [bacterium]|nr:AmmeMemoRadiSam system protein B [bacterium]